MLSKASVAIGIVAIIITAGMWAGGVDEKVKKLPNIEEAIEILKDIHERQETVEDAKSAYKEELCKEGKLDEDECK